MKSLLVSIATLTVGALLTATPAHAQYRSFVTGDSGFYCAVDGLVTIPEDGHITTFGPWPAGQKLTYDVGGGLDVGFGYAFNKYLATELQLGATWNYIDSVEGVHLHDTYYGSAPILANIVLQYPIPQTIVVPYIGAGVGGAATWFHTDNFYQPVPGGSVTLHGDDSDFVFAWQGSAGVRFQLSDKMSVGLGYRYMHVDSSTFSFGSHHGPDLDLGISAFDTHMATISFHMKF
jgi:opacity protein-like surface antigen